MSDKEDGRREGVVDTKIEGLEKRVGRLEKAFIAIGAAMATGWAKLQGFF